MSLSRVIEVHAEAPPKPALGQPCNGCGVCCLAEPCPVGMLLSLRRTGACRVLRWDGVRYVCGALGRSRWRRALVKRWIGAGLGCDCSLEPAGKP